MPRAQRFLISGTFGKLTKKSVRPRVASYCAARSCHSTSRTARFRASDEYCLALWYHIAGTSSSSDPAADGYCQATGPELSLSLGLPT